MPISLTATSLLGEGLDRFRKEVAARRVSSSSTSSNTKSKGSSSLPNFNVLSFEEGTIYDENDFASARSSGAGAGEGHATTNTFSSGPSSFEEWEEEEDPEEAYRRVIEEEEGYEDLIVGVMDDVGAEAEVEKKEPRMDEAKVGVEVERELAEVLVEELPSQETIRQRKRDKKRGKVPTASTSPSPSPMGSGGEEMKHSEVGGGSGSGSGKE